MSPSDERKDAEDALVTLRAQLAEAAEAAERRERLMDVLDEINAALHACSAVAEAYALVATAAARLFPEANGALALTRRAPELETVAQWGGKKLMKSGFAYDDCAGLRLAQIHIADKPETELSCRHFTANPEGISVCLPLVIEGDTLGLLHLDGNLRIDASTQRLLVRFGNVVKIALADLRLRESLRMQAIRDPLTGLFNRLYLDETLPRECQATERRETLLSVAMLDIDHFKRFNDSFGHEAGDTVLRELGDLLRAAVRGADIACRYGGDEFVLVLLDSGLGSAVPRLRQICGEIKRRQCVYRNRILPGIAVSVGMSEFPTHGRSPREILRAADEALYAAKNAGRDRIVLALQQSTGN